MTIKELAAKAGINKRTIDTYVDSRAVIPNAEIAVRLAKALDTTVEYLVTGNENDENLNPSDHSEIDSELYFKYHKLISKIDKLNSHDKKLNLPRRNNRYRLCKQRRSTRCLRKKLYAYNDGIEAGAKKKAIETANNLLKMNVVTIEHIAYATGLSIEEVTSLKETFN